MQKKAADVTNDIKRKAAKAAEFETTTKFSDVGTEKLKGVDLTLQGEIIAKTYAEKWDFFNTLPAIQRTWVKQYIDGAVCDYYYCDSRDYSRWRLRDLCPVLIAVVDAIDSGALPFNFRESEILKWAVDAGLMLTKDGLAVWKDIQADTSPAVPIPPDKRIAAKADTPKASDTMKNPRRTYLEILLTDFVNQAFYPHEGRIQSDTSPKADTSPAASDTDNAKNPRRTILEIASTELVNQAFYPQKGRIVADTSTGTDTASEAGTAGATVDTAKAGGNAGGLNIADTPVVDTGNDDTRKGYRVLTPGAVKLREMLYKSRQKEIDRCEKKYGAGKGKYCAEKWDTWIPKFKEKKAVQKLLHEEFNLKSGKGYIQKSAVELNIQEWRFVYEQERIERQ